MAGVGLVMRKLGGSVKPTQEITVDGDNWHIKTITTFKTSELKFTLNQPFDENTADGRTVKVRRWKDCKGEGIKGWQR